MPEIFDRRKDRPILGIIALVVEKGSKMDVNDISSISPRFGVGSCLRAQSIEGERSTLPCIETEKGVFILQQLKPLSMKTVLDGHVLTMHLAQKLSGTTFQLTDEKLHFKDSGGTYRLMSFLQGHTLNL
jgi:hypothetical protein